MQSSTAAQEQTQVEMSLARSSSERRLLHIFLILAIWLVLYVPGLFTPPLLDDADSVHAEAAREMVLRHDWTTLYINGFRYLEKAPLMYWGMAVSFEIFGVSDASARLPIALGVLALLFAVYGLGRRTINEKAGFYAAIILALSFGPYIFTRILIPDMLVGLWLTVGFAFFLRGLQEERPSRLSCWGLAASAALNVLTKGLIGVVFPVGIILAFLLVTGNLKHLLRMRLISSLLVFIAIAAPWHIMAGLANPAAGESKGFFWFYFVNEHFLRYLNKRFPKDYDTVPFVVFWAMLLVWLMPWSAFLFKALGQIPVKFRELRRLDIRRQTLLLCAIWAAVILVFFSFSSRQEYYTIPALPGLALLVGAWLSQEETAPAGSADRRAGRRVATVVLAIAIPAFIFAVLLLGYSKSVPKGADLAEILARNPEKYALSFGHIFDLTPEAMGVFRIPLAVSATALLLGAFATWWYRRRGRVGFSNIALAAMMVVFLQCAHEGLVIFSPILSSYDSLDPLQTLYKSGDLVVVNGAYEDASTLNFYGHYQLHVVNSRMNGNLYYGSLFPDSPAIFEDDASLARLWTGDKRVFLWTEDDRLPAVVKSTSAYVVDHGGGKYILTNKLPPGEQPLTPLK
jgi:4-amino-4-deoxy-L-arabinose transferase-like glycosyltransferase